MDPETIASAIEAIIGAIKGMVDASATQRWQDSVSGKLDLIIAQNATILGTLRALPLLFDAELERYFTTEVVIQGTSLSHDMDQYMRGKHPDVGAVQGIRAASETLANNIVQRGPCVYQAANAAAVLVLGIHKILKVDIGVTGAFVDTVVGYMRIWAGQSPGMFGKAITDTGVLLQQAHDALHHEARGNGVVIYTDTATESSPTGMGTISGSIHVLVDISIDETAPSFSVNNPRSTFFDITFFDDNTVQSHASSVRNRLQGEVNSIVALQARLNTLQGHEAALTQMINDLVA